MPTWLSSADPDCRIGIKQLLNKASDKVRPSKKQPKVGISLPIPP